MVHPPAFLMLLGGRRITWFWRGTQRNGNGGERVGGVLPSGQGSLNYIWCSCVAFQLPQCLPGVPVVFIYSLFFVKNQT